MNHHPKFATNPSLVEVWDNKAAVLLIKLTHIINVQFILIRKSNQVCLIYASSAAIMHAFEYMCIAANVGYIEYTYLDFLIKINFSLLTCVSFVSTYALNCHTSTRD